MSFQIACFCSSAALQGKAYIKVFANQLISAALQGKACQVSLYKVIAVGTPMEILARSALFEKKKENKIMAYMGEVMFGNAISGSYGIDTPGQRPVFR